MEDLVSAAIALVATHPAVEHVEFAGSRSRGTHEELSDWDFAVTTSDFAAVARDMPSLAAPLDPLAEQWEPLGHFPVYQLMLRGPTKVEYLFLEQRQAAKAPIDPSEETLGAINVHFWDWIWWLVTKEAAGRRDLVSDHLPQLHRHLLQPIGVDTVPGDVHAAIHAFVDRRNALEREYRISIPRALEDEIQRAIERLRREPRYASALEPLPP